MNFTIKQENTSPLLGAQLQDANFDPIDLTGATVVFNMADMDSDVVVNGGACTIPDEENGRVQYQWSAADTDVAGAFRGEFKVTYSSGEIETFPNNGYIRVTIVSDLVS